MGVNTSGVVVTPVKEIQLIGNLLNNAFHRLVMHGVHTDFSGKRFFNKGVRVLYAFPTLELSSDAETLQVRFKFRGTYRTLSVHLHCDCDNQELGKYSLSLSLGCFGKSEELMKLALYALSPLGPTYFDANDSDDIDKALIEPSITTIGELLKERLITPYDVEKRLTRFEDGINPYFISKTFDQNLSEKDFAVIRDNDALQFPKLDKDQWIKARWDHLEKYFLDQAGLEKGNDNPLIYWPADSLGEIPTSALEELKAEGVTFPVPEEETV